MRKSVREFVRILSERLSFPGPVYEFGSLIVEGQEDFGDLRGFFPDKKYVGTDMRQGKGVDLVLDLHKIDLPDETAGSALLIDTLEHVEFCRIAMAEVHRILRPGGLIVITSHMRFPVHAYPNDYWRFTQEGFRSLLHQFSYSSVGFLGDQNFPHTVAGVGIKDTDISGDMIKDINDAISLWQSLSKSYVDHYYLKLILKNIVPPFILNLITGRGPVLPGDY